MNFQILENDALSALSSPFRRQLLEELTEQPDSAAGIARRHDMSRQRIGYHMRDLEKAGYIEVVEERQQRGLKERLYRACPVAYVNRPPGTDPGIQDRFSWASLVTGFAQALWELVTLRQRADASQKRLATLGIEATLHLENPTARKAFTLELIDEFERLIEKYDRPDTNGARPFKVLLGSYPALEQDTGENNDS